MTPGSRPWDLLGFGVAAVDELIELDAWPDPDVKIDLRRHETQAGGICVNALAAATRLGARCLFAGSLGVDPLADVVRRGMNAVGVAHLDLEDRPEPRRGALAAAGPSRAFILVDRATGTRTILMDKSRVLPLAPEDLPESLIADARMLYLDAWHLDAGLVAAQRARRVGTITLADFEEHEPERVARLLPLVDHLLLPIGYARRLTGEEDPDRVLRALEPERRPATAVTLGAEGVRFIEGARPETIRVQPAFRVEPVVDTTGCGDVLHGAYAIAILDGRTVPDAMRFAAAAAALNVRRIGALAAQPTRAEVEALLGKR